MSLCFYVLGNAPVLCTDRGKRRAVHTHFFLKNDCYWTVFPKKNIFNTWLAHQPTSPHPSPPPPPPCCLPCCCRCHRLHRCHAAAAKATLPLLLRCRHDTQRAADATKVALLPSCCLCCQAGCRCRRRCCTATAALPLPTLTPRCHRCHHRALKKLPPPLPSWLLPPCCSCASVYG